MGKRFVCVLVVSIVFHKELRKSGPEQEWVIGWLLWTNRMREVHGEGYAPPRKLRNALRAALTTAPDLRPIC